MPELMRLELPITTSTQDLCPAGFIKGLTPQSQAVLTRLLRRGDSLELTTRDERALLTELRQLDTIQNVMAIVDQGWVNSIMSQDAMQGSGITGIFIQPPRDPYAQFLSNRFGLSTSPPNGLTLNRMYEIEARTAYGTLVILDPVSAPANDEESIRPSVLYTTKLSTGEIVEVTYVIRQDKEGRLTAVPTKICTIAGGEQVTQQESWLPPTEEVLAHFNPHDSESKAQAIAFYQSVANSLNILKGSWEGLYSGDFGFVDYRFHIGSSGIIYPGRVTVEELKETLCDGHDKEIIGEDTATRVEERDYKSLKTFAGLITIALLAGYICLRRYRAGKNSTSSS